MFSSSLWAGPLTTANTHLPANRHGTKKGCPTQVYPASKDGRGRGEGGDSFPHFKDWLRKLRGNPPIQPWAPQQRTENTTQLPDPLGRIQTSIRSFVWMRCGKQSTVRLGSQLLGSCPLAHSTRAVVCVQPRSKAIRPFLLSQSDSKWGMKPD